VIYAKQNNDQNIWFNLGNDASYTEEQWIKISYATFLFLDDTKQQEVIELLAAEVVMIDWRGLPDHEVMMSWNEIFIAVMTPYFNTYKPYGMMRYQTSHCLNNENTVYYPFAYMHASPTEQVALEITMMDFLRSIDLETEHEVVVTELSSFLNDWT
jgi:hypothetical protein